MTPRDAPQFGSRLHFKRCQALPKETPFPFFRGPLFLGPLFSFLFFLSPAKVGLLEILRRTRSNAGRTSARSLSGRIESIWETPSKERVTAPFLVQKALETANSEKFVFRVRRQMCCLGLQNSLVFRRKPAPDVCHSEFRLLPQPAELVTACHRFVTARFLGAKARKSGPSSGPCSPQHFPRSDSPPRTWLGARQRRGSPT